MLPPGLLVVAGDDGAFLPVADRGNAISARPLHRAGRARLCSGCRRSEQGGLLPERDLSDPEPYPAPISIAPYLTRFLPARPRAEGETSGAGTRPRTLPVSHSRDARRKAATKSLYRRTASIQSCFVEACALGRGVCLVLTGPEARGPRPEARGHVSHDSPSQRGNRVRCAWGADLLDARKGTESLRVAGSIPPLGTINS